MLSRVMHLMEDILKEPPMLFVGLFRADGVPILVKCVKRMDFLNLIYWLEGHVKDSLNQMVTENLNDLNAKFNKFFIRILPLSRTLALVMIAEDEMSLYKFEMDLVSLKSQLRNS